MVRLVGLVLGIKRRARKGSRRLGAVAASGSRVGRQRHVASVGSVRQWAEVLIGGPAHGVERG
jgi:hypothetical protein